ncbi:MAG: hypothetical protein WAV89_11305 [Ignavibacteriaceae bacterium]
MFNEDSHSFLLIDRITEMVKLKTIIAGANFIMAVRNLIIAAGFLKIAGTSLEVAG